MKLTPELRALERQESQVLDGGPDAFEARVAELRGHPVVINQWASWCGPCRYDKDTSVARLFGGGRAWPTTAFYAASGKLVKTHLGAYASEAKLDDDIRRYALGG